VPILGGSPMACLTWHPGFPSPRNGAIRGAGGNPIPMNALLASVRCPATAI